MKNAPSNQILLLSSTPPPSEEIRKLSQCDEIPSNLSMEHFWCQNPMGFHEILAFYATG